MNAFEIVAESHCWPFCSRAALVVASLAPATLAVAAIELAARSSSSDGHTLTEIWQNTFAVLAAGASTLLTGVMIGSLWLFKKDDRPDTHRKKG